MSKGIKGVWESLFSSLKKSKEPEKIIKFDEMNIKKEKKWRIARLEKDGE
jgi:hypothetical protein